MGATSDNKVQILHDNFKNLDRKYLCEQFPNVVLCVNRFLSFVLADLWESVWYELKWVGLSEITDCVFFILIILFAQHKLQYLEYD